MTRPFRVAAATAILTAVAFFAVGCGTTSVEAGAEDAPDATSEACQNDTTSTSSGAVDITDGVGRKVHLDAPAERIAVLEWQQAEDAMTLCVAPVAVSDPKGYATWVSAEQLPEDVIDLGTRGEPDLDALYGADPDLIIVEAFDADAEIVKNLEKESDVPVLVTVGADTSDPIGNMKNVFTLIAEATGRTERAEAVLADFDQHLADAKSKVASASLPTTDFVFFDGWIEGSNLVIRPYGKGALFTAFGEELGLTAAWTDDIDKAYGSGGVDPAYGLAQTDLEGLTAVGDANLFYSKDEEGGYTDELDQSSIWTSLPAVKEGRAHAFPAGVWGAGGPLSGEQAVDAFVDVILAK
ncbi:iron-siderophore ABC transporter substrate-binding protein [Leucobacter sp. USHLN153]|uniref:iron-siderophore ABC transporter substrate-binding protein n=1 Tax=Leucobacter sp. USHLN153 TaxID=3081268 RepID=UPI003019240F